MMHFCTELCRKLTREHKTCTFNCLFSVSCWMSQRQPETRLGVSCLILLHSSHGEWCNPSPSGKWQNNVLNGWIVPFLLMLLLSRSLKKGVTSSCSESVSGWLPASGIPAGLKQCLRSKAGLWKGFSQLQREELRRGKVLRTSREEGRGESCEDLYRVPEWHLQAVSPGGGIPQGKEFLSLRSWI